MKGEGDLLIIGRVLKAFGLMGDVKVSPMTDRIERFESLPHVFVERSGRTVKIEVERTRIGDGCVYIKLGGVSNRDEAAGLAGEYLYIDRLNAAEIDPSSHYYFDVIGCSVRTEGGELVGTVFDIRNAGSCDVYFVKASSAEAKEVLIPAIAQVVKSIDTDRKEIVIQAVDGLL